MIREDLDILLYAWLSEPSEREADQRFARYFKAAFPEMCRFLRSLRADAATAQDISQQALIKLFAHLGPERKAADSRLREALSDLQPLDFGALHVRLVRAWREQVGGFRDAVLRFHIPEGAQSSDIWRQQRDEINGRTEPLLQQGTHFLREVRERVASQLHALIERESPQRGIAQGCTSGVPLQPGDAVGEAWADTADAQVASFVATLLQYAAGLDGTQVDATLGCAGAVGFVTRTRTVCESVPVLAIPSNGLLFTIAKRKFLDSVRSKRPDSVELTAGVADEGSGSVLEEWDLEDGFPLDHAPQEEVRTDVTVFDMAGEVGREGSVESRYRAFLEFLRAPLTRAEGALAEAASEGKKAKMQQARVDSLRRKHERLMAVLGALHESPQPSEEEIARRQGLSRNQVKYVIERIREEFDHFFPDLAREAQGRRKRHRAGT